MSYLPAVRLHSVRCLPTINLGINCTRILCLQDHPRVRSGRGALPHVVLSFQPPLLHPCRTTGSLVPPNGQCTAANLASRLVHLPGSLPALFLPSNSPPNQRVRSWDDNSLCLASPRPPSLNIHWPLSQRSGPPVHTQAGSPSPPFPLQNPPFPPNTPLPTRLYHATMSLEASLDRATDPAVSEPRREDVVRFCEEVKGSHWYNLPLLPTTFFPSLHMRASHTPFLALRRGHKI